jgi:DTW domain-containing protein YfiP
MGIDDPLIIKSEDLERAIRELEPGKDLIIRGIPVPVCEDCGWPEENCTCPEGEW